MQLKYSECALAHGRAVAADSAAEATGLPAETTGTPAGTPAADQQPDLDRSGDAAHTGTPPALTPGQIRVKGG